MKTVIVQAGQTLLDIAIQEAGRVEAVAEIARLNAIGISEAIQPGAVLAIDVVTAQLHKQIVKIGLVPATSYRLPGELLAGIGTMAIATTFRVAPVPTAGVGVMGIHRNFRIGQPMTRQIFLNAAVLK